MQPARLVRVFLQQQQQVVELRTGWDSNAKATWLLLYLHGNAASEKPVVRVFGCCHTFSGYILFRLDIYKSQF
jgi:hypothetical protein